MKYLLIIMIAPVLLISNFLGGLSALFIVGAINGYENVMELLKKAE